VVHRPTHCAQCGALLLGDDGQPYRHQVTEWPSLKATVTEHQIYSVTCLCCGATTRGALPSEVAASQFGPNLVSLMALLMGCYRLSKRQVADLLANCFTTHVAPSSVVNQQQVISQALAQPVDELQRYVQQQPACNVDETSWRQAEAKRAWFWVVVTAVVTVFHIAAARLLASCWGKSIMGWWVPTATATITGSTRHSASCAGAISCAISSRSWSAARSRSSSAPTSKCTPSTCWCCGLVYGTEPCRTRRSWSNFRPFNVTSAIGSPRVSYAPARAPLTPAVTWSPWMTPSGALRPRLVSSPPIAPPNALSAIRSCGDAVWYENSICSFARQN
jgi:Transposase IS66 family/zinc-finger binding domain of transposase IS66